MIFIQVRNRYFSLIDRCRYATAKRKISERQMHTVEETLLEYLKPCAPAGVEIHTDLRLIEDLNLDSLDVVEMTMHLEDSLGITVLDDSDIRAADTIGDLASRIRRKYGVE
jgi:acyl carrier protein